MVEREQTRLRERDRNEEDRHPYEVFFSTFKERRDLANDGQVVIKARTCPGSSPGRAAASTTCT